MPALRALPALEAVAFVLLFDSIECDSNASSAHLFCVSCLSPVVLSKVLSLLLSYSRLVTFRFFIDRQASTPTWRSITAAICPAGIWAITCQCR
jgi:hypothetical protein